MTAFERRFVAVCVAAIALWALVAVIPGGPVHRAFASSLTMSDFRAFYCGGRVTLERGNPYLAEPLLACEDRAVATITDDPPARDAYVDPAPLPAYVFALIAPFALLPYFTAALLWTVTISLALVGVALLVARLSSLSPVVTLAAIVVAEGNQSIPYGQIPPLAILALCASAYALALARPRLAAIFAALAMVEPHVALPACYALVLWAPRTRRTLVACAVALAFLALLVVGPAALGTYFVGVLPVQQARELGAPFQYSLTWLLHVAGLSDAFALSAGWCDYAVMLAAGVFLARTLASRFGSPIPLVLFPPAVAMLGGPYVHLQQIAAAMPFVLYASGRAPSVSARRLAWAAGIALLAGWTAAPDHRLVAISSLCLAVVVVALNAHRSPAVRALAAAFAVCAYLLVWRGFAAVPAHVLAYDSRPESARAPVTHTPLASAGAMPADSDAWYHDAALRLIAVKAPTWGGLITAFAIPLTLRRKRKERV